MILNFFIGFDVWFGWRTATGGTSARSAPPSKLSNMHGGKDTTYSMPKEKIDTDEAPGPNSSAISSSGGTPLASAWP